ncbi:hypothetical protein Q8A67_025790 [Cirrhinus molitorella]|uniref:Uncharacterized protein n=1 Tax=Cirrhinus molitorella TaxID=172907 RepID=A0AA88TA05_9TELE|nr:hypothetical protein Q8A67_025790 [Cirrhinus molitorella]
MRLALSYGSSGPRWMNSTGPSTVSSGSEDGRRRREILAFTAVRGKKTFECLTFRESADVFGQRRQTRVVLRRKPVAVQGFGPSVSMTGQHWSAALLHGHTHAPTRLDKPVDVTTCKREQQASKQRPGPEDGSRCEAASSSRPIEEPLPPDCCGPGGWANAFPSTGHPGRRSSGAGRGRSVWSGPGRRPRRGLRERREAEGRMDA